MYPIKIKSMAVLFLLTLTNLHSLSIDRSVTISSDDAEEYRTKVSLSSSDLEFVRDRSKNQMIGMRFQSIAVPKGATITKAYLQFQTDETDSEATTLTIHGEKVNDAQTFTRASSNISSRVKTIASTSWSPEAWSSVGESTIKQRSTELKNVVQEIVNQGGWSSGNAMAFIVSGTGKRVAESYDGTSAPALHIEYSLGGGTDVDIIKPVITLIGDAMVPLTVGDNYQDAGATASDNVDTNVVVDTVGSVDTTTAGSYTLTYQATDSAGNEAITVTRTIKVIEVNNGSVQSIDVKVLSSSDDAEEYQSKVSLSSSDLEFVRDRSKNQMIGMRFQSIAVPKGATITKAYLQFQTDETDSEATTLTIHGEKVNDAQTFTRASSNISSRVKTIASTSWSPEAWSSVGESTIKQRSTELKNVVQEIVNQGGWSSGNAMAFIVSGTGKRVAESYDGTSESAPALHIEYSVVDAPIDTVKPVITLLGSVELNITVGSNYIDAGATATDNIDGNITANIVSNSDLNLNRVGTYTITYDVNDSSNNQAIRVSRTIHVENEIIVDTEKPVITLIGDTVVTLRVGDNYSDAGATANDNVDATTVIVDTVGSVDTTTAGSYTLTYHATDSAGNEAIAVTRTINVIEIIANEKVIYENAEDGTTENWIIYDNDPIGATITNIYDNSKQSNVIQFLGDKKLNSYQYGAETGADTWNNKLDRTIEWSMNFDGPYKIYIFVNTSNGTRKMVYDFKDVDDGFITDYVHHGLGAISRDGNWHNYSRDLEADLKEYESNNTILSVNGIRVYGSGKIDDIQMLKELSPLDTIAPIITLVGSDVVTVEQNANYIELGATATDEITGNVAVMIMGTVDTSTVGSYTITYIAVDRAGNLSTKIRTVNVVLVNADTTSLILNEYNAVASNQMLKANGNDTYFGQINGNGGSWLEMVTTVRHLDLRGMTLIIKQDGVDDFQAKIPNIDTLAHLRKGTIVTISSEPTDMSYAPFNPNGDDWTVNINKNDLIVEQGAFVLGSESVTVVISNNVGNVLLAATGESISAVSIDDQEVFKLKKNPLHGILSTDSAYGDDNDEQALSTFGEANIWIENGQSKTQNFSELRANADLTEVGGLIISNIDALNAIEDAESLLYIPQNNTLWITDDDSHNVFEMDFTSKEVLSSFNDVDLGLFAETIKDACVKHAKPTHSDGACDIESIAYDESNDLFYLFVGNTASQSAVYKLTRGDVNESFVLDDYRDLNYSEYADAIFIEGEFIVVNNNFDLNLYDFNTNETIGTSLFKSDYGKIVGLAYANGTLWLTTLKHQLISVNWATKELINVYNMPDNGVFDPRGIEVINNQLYILEGINASGSNQVLAPYNHVLKNSIHIYNVP